MAGYIPTRLVPLLEAQTLDDVEEDNLQRLIGIEETDDLDFKQEHYKTSGEKRKELPYDIADRANHIGGLIIIGMEEEAGRATDLTPVDPDPCGVEETTRIHQVAGSKIHPYPEIYARRIDSTSKPGKAFYAISIPPSSWAPHAVIGDDGSLRYPRRSGTTRRWLSESEIADAYRQRHGEEGEQIDRAHKIHGEMAEEVRDTEGWLIVTLVPNRVGRMQITRATIREYEDWINQRSKSELPGLGRSLRHRHARADFRSIRLTDGHRPEDPAYSQQARMFEGGAGTLANRYARDQRDDFLEIKDEMLLGDVINALLLLGQHAVERTLTGGDAVVLAELVPIPNIQMVLTSYDRTHFDQTDGSILVSTSTPVGQHMVSLEDISNPGPGLLVAARSILCDLMSPFGVPEPWHVSQEGALSLFRLSDYAKQAVKGWADSYGAHFD